MAGNFEGVSTNPSTNQSSRSHSIGHLVIFCHILSPRIALPSVLALVVLAQPNHPDKPIPRESMDARDKLIAEAGTSEMKIILGWMFDFRRLRISLPENKFIAWTTTINKLLANGSSTAKELESTIG